MVMDESVDPVLLMKYAPMVGVKLPDNNPPRALSALPAIPKLYVSPVFPDPVPVLYKAFALVPDSRNNHPAGSAEEVPEEASVLKSCWYVPPDKLIWEKRDRGKESIIHTLKNR